MTKISDKLRETLGLVQTMNTNVGREVIDVDSILEDEPSFPIVVEPREEKKFEMIEVPSVATDIALSDVKSDYVHSRNMHYTLNDSLGKVLQESINLFEETQHPKLIGEITALATTMLAVARSQMDIQKVYKSVIAESEPQQAKTINNIQVNQTVNSETAQVTSTSDIIRLIEETNKAQVIEMEE